MTQRVICWTTKKTQESTIVYFLGVYGEKNAKRRKRKYLVKQSRYSGSLDCGTGKTARGSLPSNSGLDSNLQHTSTKVSQYTNGGTGAHKINNQACKNANAWTCCLKTRRWVQCCGAGADFFAGRSREPEPHFLRRLRLHVLARKKEKPCSCVKH